MRSFTQNNYRIQLKPTHVHEIVAAYFADSSRLALLADKKWSIRTLKDTELIVLNHATQLIEQRLRTLENLPSGLPAGDILAESVYVPITTNEQFSEKVWRHFRRWR